MTDYPLEPDRRAMESMGRRSLALVLTALVLGVLARQTMLVLAPVIAIWILLADGWRGPDGRVSWVAAGSAIAVPAVVYGLATQLAAGFSAPGFPLSRLTILDTVLDLPETSGDLVNHFAHTAIVPIVVTAVLASWRGFDTLGEVTVIFVAGIGVLLLLRRRQEGRR